jgi:hypothetical protein
MGTGMLLLRPQKLGHYPYMRAVSRSGDRAPNMQADNPCTKHRCPGHRNPFPMACSERCQHLRLANIKDKRTGKMVVDAKKILPHEVLLEGARSSGPLRNFSRPAPSSGFISGRRSCMIRDASQRDTVLLHYRDRPPPAIFFDLLGKRLPRLEVAVYWHIPLIICSTSAVP